MGKINNKTQYPFDSPISDQDYLIGTDGDSSNKKTKNYQMAAIASYVLSKSESVMADGTWNYSFVGDTHDYGDFYTPPYDFNGGEDPNIANLNQIVISNRTIHNVPAEKLLELAGQSGVMILFKNQNDLNNFFLVKDPILTPASLVADYTQIDFTQSYYSKSFKLGDPYSIHFMFTSNFTPDLYRETNASATNNPTAPPDGGVHIGKQNGVQVLADKVVLNRDVVELPLLPELTVEGKAVVRAVGYRPDNKQIYSIPFDTSQSDWTQEDDSKRDYIQNRFPQKDVSTNYTIQSSDNGHTIFVNNGVGDVDIRINPGGADMHKFRQCRIIQMGTGIVNVELGGVVGFTELHTTTGDGLLGGKLRSAMLFRQHSVVGGVETPGNFYLLNGSGVGLLDWSSEEV